MGSFIGADDTWSLWAILAASGALAIHLEQKYKWANKVTGCILALTITMILSNLNIIPTESDVYDIVWSYVVPLAVPMLLFTADIKRIWKDSGRVLVIYLISSVGTVLGGLLAYFLLKNHIPGLNSIAPMFVGTYVGGSINYVAMSTHFTVPAATVSAGLVADNLLMALYFFTLIAIPSIHFIKKQFNTPIIDKLASQNDSERDENETMAAKYWGAKEISLKDIAMTVALSLLIVAVSKIIANYFGGLFQGKDFFSNLLSGLLGNQYLIITTLTMIIASLFPSKVGSIRGSNEIGTFLIYLFFAVIGAPASIALILQEAPLLLLFAFIILLVNLVWTLTFGKLLKFDLEQVLIASNGNVGGPTTAAAMAVSKGWTELIIPAILVGTLGYVIGNYYGIFIGIMFGG